MINNGGTDETGVVVTDPIPTRTTYVPGSANMGGAPDPAQNSLVWNLGVLPAGGSVTLTFQVTVNVGAPLGAVVDNVAFYRSNETVEFPSLPAAAVVDRDWDGDGVTDRIDVDDDNDGILDTTEGTADTDGDTIPDQYDLDSDDDGITDCTEASAPGAPNPDADGDGLIDGFADANGDGWSDALDPALGGTPLPVREEDRVCFF